MGTSVLMDARHAVRLLLRQPRFSAAAALLAAGIGAAAAVFTLVNTVLMTQIGLDARVVLFAIATSTAAAIICGVVPAWSATRNLAGSPGSTRSLTGTRRDGLIRRTFVAVQVAGSTALLIGVGLVAHSLARIEAVDPGLTADRALTVQLSLPPARYATRDSVAAFYDALAPRLAALPGVRSVGAVSLPPLTGLLAAMDVELPDRPAPPPDQVPQAHFRIASAGYFSAAGIAILDGREFADRDSSRALPVAVVSDAFAARHWPGESAVGKHLRIVQPPPSPDYEVVGVAANVKQYGLDGAPTADLYVPIRQMPPGQASLIAARMYWVLRARADGRLLAGEARDAIHAVDPDVAMSGARTLEEILGESVGPRRINARLLELFGESAMLLAALGTYAITAFAAGIGAGLLVAFAAARSLDELLFATSPHEPAVYAAVAASVVGITVLATYVPARRAAQADPALLLHP